MRETRIAVIGAGPGGLTAAMLLQSQGFQVSVFEKDDKPGGRTSHVDVDGYRFDKGPTFLSMPHIVEEIFSATGRDLAHYISWNYLDPMYELFFEDSSFRPTSDKQEMKRRIAASFPGDEKGYDRFMHDLGKRWDALLPVLEHEHGSLLDYMKPRTLKALPHLALGKSVYDVLSQYFSDERLKLSFTFQSKYLGMSPWDCPGAFSILSYMEHEYGIVHPTGGLNQIPKAMAKAFEEDGGHLYLNTPVKQIRTKKQQAVGVELENGEVFGADEVVVNADFAYAATELFDEPLNRWNKDKVAAKDYSCSAFMLYAGVDTTYSEAAHHSIVFSNDYKKNVEEMIHEKIVSDDPSIYIHNPAVTDDTLAPAGKSPIYMLAPVPNNQSGIDWESNKESFRDLVLDQVESRSPFKGLRDHIEVEKIYTPTDWQVDSNVYEGAVFNLSHRLNQMMYFRPHNKFEDVRNCWLVGGGTHPGSGLPTIIVSGRITAQALTAKYARERAQ